MDYTKIFKDTFEDASAFSCISAKLNLIAGQEEPEQLSYIIEYISEYHKVHSYTAGRHDGGREGKPHIHVHFIVDRCTAPTNPSLHRTRWCKKDLERTLEGVSFKYQYLNGESPRHEFLCYPLKEGKELQYYYYILQGQQMSQFMISWLRNVGNSIYQKQVALRERQDSCAERKKNSLLNLYDLVKDVEIKSYKEMVFWLDQNYIAKIDLEEYPDPKNYISNVQKIAVKKGLKKYSDFFSL